jgi:hypothetical protein
VPVDSRTVWYSLGGRRMHPVFDVRHFALLAGAGFQSAHNMYLA